MPYITANHSSNEAGTGSFSPSTGPSLLELSQMASKGKVSMEELSSQLEERRPAAPTTDGARTVSISAAG